MIPSCEDSRSCFPLAVVCATALVLGQANDTPLYRDPAKPIEARIRDLIGRLTIEEKAQQLNHLNKGLPRLGIKQWGGWNQTLHGVWSKEPTTLFPVPTAMGATWDPDLVHQVADAMSDEARALYNAGKDGPALAARPGLPVAGHQHQPRPALGTHPGSLQRGSVPDRPHGGGLRPAACRARTSRT